MKFFRSIRQNLVSDGITTKYIKYAIGEIILVVLGILIAIGINNLVENHKTEEKINQFLTSLKSDLTTDLKEIKSVIGDQSNRSIALSEAIDLSKNSEIEKIITRDSLSYYKAPGNITFFPIVGSYKAASNDGLISNIDNEELKHSILNLYEHLYLRVAHNGVILDERTGQVEWESRQYVDNTKEGYVFAKTALLDTDFVLQLGYLNKFTGFYIVLCNNTKSGIEEVLNNIDLYLNSSK